MLDIKPFINRNADRWIALRRDLHRHPELAFEEVRTAGIVAERLNALGLEVQTGVGKTGVVAILEGDRPGPTVLVRADMDALPVHEENEVDYASQTPGKMHACGHDGHTTIALGAAETLSAHRDAIAGRVKFVFQPAEEIGLGAEAMLNDGVLRDPAPDFVLGLHLWNYLPAGNVILTDGPLMAAANDFRVTLTGRGGHGGLPHETIDPVLAAGHVVTALQSIVSRNLDPAATAVVSVTEVKGGDSFNVIPGQVTLRGTIRAFDTAVRDQVEERLNAIVTGVASAFGCTADIEVRKLTLPVVNAPEVNARLREVFAAARPDVTLLSDVRSMVAEDVSYFLNAAPGAFFLVGSADSARGLDYPHHHPRFDWDDETVIPLAVELLSRAIASYVVPDGAPSV